MSYVTEKLFSTSLCGLCECTVLDSMSAGYLNTSYTSRSKHCTKSLVSAAVNEGDMCVFCDY